MSPPRYSADALSLCGLILMGIGVYFAFVRPAVLPEDARYLGMAASQVQAAVPGISRWLDKVFRVMGGYIFTAGLLILYVAQTSFLAHSGSAGAVVPVSGATSIGAMTATNFVLGSDFRWMLLGVALFWIAALSLYVLGR